MSGISEMVVARTPWGDLMQVPQHGYKVCEITTKEWADYAFSDMDNAVDFALGFEQRFRNENAHVLPVVCVFFPDLASVAAVICNGGHMFMPVAEYENAGAKWTIL